MPDELEILRPTTPVTLNKGTTKELPLPFDFGPAPRNPFMTRAKRRRAKREARKVAKRLLR